jgi:hypothetical protein
MAVYVLRGGVLVEKNSVWQARESRGDFPTPRLSRLEPYQSPIDGKEITSWAARDKDLKDSNSYDPRDVKKSPDARSSKPVQLDLFTPRD